MFEADYQPLSREHPEWGSVAVLPWDTEIFEFPVATLKLGEARAVARARDEFRARLTEWAEEHRVELVSCSVADGEPFAISLLQSSDLVFVDCALEAVNSRIQSTNFAATKAVIRPVAPEEQPEVERIAESAFRFGRYHSDLRFPRGLADRRYRRWLSNAFATLGPASRIYVASARARVRGFMHVTVEGASAYLTIAAVEPTLQGGIVGVELSAGALAQLKQEGIRRVSTKVSAPNRAIVNMVPHFGGRFSKAEAVFHWHAPHAPHLLDAPSMYEASSEE